MTTEVSETESHDPHFEPVVTLPEQVVPTLEEDEDVLFKMRAKLFRFASEIDPPEWKERGTGDVKLLKHKKTSRIRLLMRRDKTFKTCANHYLDKRMQLVSNSGSDRAWVWNAFSDFAEEEPREELLAIRFLNAENANKFKDKFDECKEMQPEIDTPDETSDDEEEEQESEDPKKNDEETETVAEKLEELSVKEAKDEEDSSEKISEETKDKKAEKKINLAEDSPEK